MKKCPFLVAATMTVRSTVALPYREGDEWPGDCMGDECAMWDKNGDTCGMRQLPRPKFMLCHEDAIEHEEACKRERDKAEEGTDLKPSDFDDPVTGRPYRDELAEQEKLTPDEEAEPKCASESPEPKTCSCGTCELGEKMERDGTFHKEWYCRSLIDAGRYMHFGNFCFSCGDLLTETGAVGRENDNDEPAEKKKTTTSRPRPMKGTTFEHGAGEVRS